MFLQKISQKRTTKAKIEEGFLIDENGGHIKFDKENDQFLLLKSGKYFTDITNEDEVGRLYFDHGPNRQIWWLDELDGIWLIRDK